MSFTNLLMTPEDRLNQVFEKNPNGITIQNIAEILSKKSVLVKQQIAELNIWTKTTGKDKKNYIYISPEWVQLLIQSFATVDDVKAKSAEILSQKSRLTCAKAMKKYGIVMNEWVELTKSQHRLFSIFEEKSKTKYYVPEENIPEFLNAIKKNRELKIANRKTF